MIGEKAIKLPQEPDHEVEVLSQDEERRLLEAADPRTRWLIELYLASDDGIDTRLDGIDTRLDGVRFARILWWPGPVHEGNGTRQTIIDVAATPEQRAALIAMDRGDQGGTFFEIFAAVCPNLLEPAFANIALEMGYATQGHRAVLFATGLLLILLVAFALLAADLIHRRSSHG